MNGAGAAAVLLGAGLFVPRPAPVTERPGFALASFPAFVELANAAPEGAESRIAVPPDRLTARTWRLAGTFSAGVAAGGYALWWRKRDFGRFEHASEGWFREETYAGRADKTSHLVLGYIGGRFLQERLERMGHPAGRARILSVAMASAGGLLVEVGDAFTEYRFSWEDAVITSAGSVFGALVDAGGLGDIVGLRFGRVPTRKPDRGEGEPGSSAYHHTIDTRDVHLSGRLPRPGVEPGPFRFLVVSGTYAPRGYGFDEPPGCQRLVGVEVGLDVHRILRELGVREETWWGGPLLFVARYFRVPWTAVGVRYDLNHGRWSGPDFGDRYSPWPDRSREPPGFCPAPCRSVSRRCGRRPSPRGARPAPRGRRRRRGRPRRSPSWSA